MIREGKQAPTFEAKIQDGSRVALGDWLCKGPLVLYFYPKDFTPG
jgi:peroxiredoxin Q/BCP